MPIDYNKYPPNWNEIRERILKRAHNRCEFCGTRNGAFGFRNDNGTFHEVVWSKFSEEHQKKLIRIVLTVAHLDHDEENWNVKDDRLRALCQRCHLIYDIQEKKRRLKNKKAIKDLFQ